MDDPNWGMVPEDTECMLLYAATRSILDKMERQLREDGFPVEPCHEQITLMVKGEKRDYTAYLRVKGWSRSIAESLINMG